MGLTKDQRIKVAQGFCPYCGAKLAPVQHKFIYAGTGQSFAVAECTNPDRKDCAKKMLANSDKESYG